MVHTFIKFNCYINVRCMYICFITFLYIEIFDEANNALYQKYKAFAENEKNVKFDGRLGEYKYYDMDQWLHQH